jgi:hypothetical protein
MVPNCDQPVRAQCEPHSRLTSDRVLSLKISGALLQRPNISPFGPSKETRRNDSDMTHLAQYIEAAERDNTRRSYASAIRHFEIEWKGLLPSTADAISRYLADHAATLAMNTLRSPPSTLASCHELKTAR